MPKLYGVEEKKINGKTVDKENKAVFFTDATHTYYDKDDMAPYISVTTLINHYCQEFNEEFWSAYKALEAIVAADIWPDLKKVLLAKKKFDIRIINKLHISEEEFLNKQNEIKAEYKRKRDEACERGTAIHLKKELQMYESGGKFDFKAYGLNDDVSGEYKCFKDHYELDEENGIYPEYLISVKSKDGLLRVAGQVDLIHKHGNDIRIYDYKTNGSIDKHSFYDKVTKKRQMMKYPLSNIEDSNYWHYCVQLSLYGYMIQHLYPECNIKSLTLIHIDETGKETNIDCPYLKDEVEKMLKHYKRQLKIQDELNRNKSVI